MTAFDSAATTYDTDFTHHQLGVWLREMVRGYIPFKLDDHILELGCGTGEDALWMTGLGAHVTATDVSPEMLRLTAQKTAGLPVHVQPFDMNQPTPLPHTYDGVFSNFGAFNCVADRAQLAQHLAPYIKQGGKVILVVMGRWCFWEIGWYLLHGQVKTAFRRLQPTGQPAHVGDGQTVTVWYPTPGQLKQEFAPYFHYERTIGIGTLLPPSYLAHLVTRHPRLFAQCARFDRRYGQYFAGDHYLIEFTRR